MPRLLWRSWRWMTINGTLREPSRRRGHVRAGAAQSVAAMEGKAYRGPEEVMDWWRDEILVSGEFFQVLPERFQRVDEKILVTGRWNARGIESGVELDIPASWIVEVRDGKIAYWQTYTDHAQARRDIGLEG